MSIMEILGNRLLFCDGGMGTLLQAQGLTGGEVPEAWNLSRPDAILHAHKSYLEAGCDIVTTNTFGANAVKLEASLNCAEVTKAAVEIAKKAVADAGKGFVALDVGPSGKLLSPMGDLPFEKAVEGFATEIKAGAAAGADLILIETMSDLYETKAAVLAAKESCDLPIFVTLAFDKTGKLLTGGDAVSSAALLEGFGVDAIGLNCGLGPKQLLPIFRQLQKYTGLPIIVNPNAGLPEIENGKTVYKVEPDEFAGDMKIFADEGAWIVGGCCGTTPAHIKATYEKCRAISPKPLVKKHLTWVSSYAQTVIFGEKPVLIGERINPTGKARLKQALRENDDDYILREAVTQQEKGAQILDVNAGLPDINEKEVLASLIPKLQSVTDLPLQTDTADFSAMESALRVYNGRPLINSVNGKKESMDAVFPLVKKYGGTVIALTLDESGIPETAQQRVDIAKKIISEAEKYGIGKENLIFDPLAMTISADANAAKTTLEAVREITKLGCHTSLGVSNISFGLPNRDLINAAFFTMAMQSGLSAAIMNPNSEPMMNAYRAFCALDALDENCADYIAAASGETAKTPVASVDIDVKTAVVRGLKDSASASALKAVVQQSPMQIIEQQLIPALDFVGAEFEAKRLYLPQLLMSADAAKTVFEILRAEMLKSGEKTQSKGKFILATVKGDVHDIGKNIVKVLLENYGWQVNDLGRDVPPEAVLEAAKRDNVKMIGLSALMTTTVVNMEATIKLLKQNIPDCIIFVGGAVLTRDYAMKIGADYYCADAMCTVRLADEAVAKM